MIGQTELFVLATDQGFLNEPNVVWETLSNVEGDGHFVDATFHTYRLPEMSSQRVSTSSATTAAFPTPPANSKEQIDHEYVTDVLLDIYETPLILSLLMLHQLERCSEATVATWCCCVPMPTRHVIPPGSVNEYQWKLGSKRAYHAMHQPRIHGLAASVGVWLGATGNRGQRLHHWGSGRTFATHITRPESTGYQVVIGSCWWHLHDLIKQSVHEKHMNIMYT